MRKQRSYKVCQAMALKLRGASPAPRPAPLRACSCRGRRQAAETPTPHPGRFVRVIRGVFRACCDVDVAAVPWLLFRGCGATHAVSASGRQLHACRLARALQHHHVHPALRFRISLSV